MFVLLPVFERIMDRKSRGSINFDMNIAIFGVGFESGFVDED